MMGAGQPFGLLEEFSADRSDPALSEGVGDWCSHGGLEDLEAFGSEDLVEGLDELAASVSYQCSWIRQGGVAEEQVAGGLGGPGARRIRGETREEHLAGVDVDEDHAMVLAQPPRPGRLCDAELAAHLLDGHAARQELLALGELPDNLLRRSSST
jgi:hypothetical protein